MAGERRPPAQDPSFLEQMRSYGDVPTAVENLGYDFAQGLRSAAEGTMALPGTAKDLLQGFAQREFRERSPVGMRGSAPAMDTRTYDAAKAAVQEVVADPVEAAREIRDSLVSYVRQGLPSPQSTARFLGENINPLPKVKAAPGARMSMSDEGTRINPIKPDDHPVDQSYVRFDNSLVERGFRRLDFEDPAAYTRNGGATIYYTLQRGPVTMGLEFRRELIPQRSVAYSRRREPSMPEVTQPYIELAGLVIDPAQRQRGFAHAAMQDLTSVADANNAIITLQATPFGAKRKKDMIPAQKLQDFYRQHGFEDVGKVEGGMIMIRRPRAPEGFAEGGAVSAQQFDPASEPDFEDPRGFAEGGEVKKEESPMASPVGGAKQMLADLESQDKKLAERKRPRSKESIEEERASKELDRGTLMSGSLVAPTIAREGELTVRRFAGGGSADKGKLTLTLEPVGGVEFGPANPAPRSLKDFVPGAADLPRSPPQKAPGWGDAASYNPQGLAYGFGTGIRNTLEGLASLPGTAADMLGGFLQREVRERSPEGMRGSAPAMDTTTYDAAKSALKEAAGNPVEAARNIRDSLVSYVRQGVATPQSTAQFIGENVNPLRPRGPVSRGPVLDAVRPSNYGVMLPQRRADGTSRPTVISEYRNKAMSHLHLKQDLGLDEEVVGQIKAFLDTKPTNYFSRQMGTPKDPVLKNILAGQYRTPQIGTHFPAEMLREPDSRAEAVRLYDDELGFQSWVLNPNPSPGEVLLYGRFRPEGLAKKESIRQDIRGRIAAQGVPESEINFKKGLGFGGDSLYYSLEGKDFFDSRSVSEGGNVAKDLYARYEQAKMDPYRSSSLDPSVVTAIEKQEPIYAFMPGGPLESIFNPEALVDYLATLPPNKIKNIRFEDALRGATEVVKKRDVVQTTIQAIRDNKTVPRSVFDEGTRLVKMDVKDADPFSPPYTGEDAVQWRQIIDPEATRYESAYLKHSVDGYAEDGVFNYGPEQKRNFREGKVQLYSLRDKRGMPVTTVEVKTVLPIDVPALGHVINILDDKPVQVVTQIRGAGRATGNANPPRWAQRAVVDLLRGPLKGIPVADMRYQIPDRLQGGFPMGLLPPSPPSWMLEWGAYKKFKDEYDKLDPIQQYNYDQAYGKPDSMFPAPGDDAPQ